MTIWTKEYRKEYDRKRHAEEHEEKSLRQKKRCKTLREWMLEMKSGMKCSKCLENHPACLQFHHLRDKDLAVSDMVKAGFGKERILKEIEKCVVLCGNCHAKEHFIEGR